MDHNFSNKKCTVIIFPLCSVSHSFICGVFSPPILCRKKDFAICRCPVFQHCITSWWPGRAALWIPISSFWHSFSTDNLATSLAKFLKVSAKHAYPVMFRRLPICPNVDRFFLWSTKAKLLPDTKTKSLCGHISRHYLKYESALMS